MKSLAHYWYRSGFLVWLLLPISWLYCAIVIFRRKLYQHNLLKSYSARVPVIVVGNIVAGGSGKTPLLISLCEYLQQHGFRPGVVSRGYGGKLVGIKQVQDEDPPQLVGDEPLMIYQRTNVPVVVGADRVVAVDYLLQNNQCDIVLSDDGLQHYRMRRDFELAVVDASRRFGNGFCLPAGPLRERVSRLNEVDIVVYNGVLIEPSAEGCSYTLKIVSLYRLHGDDSRSVSAFADRPVHAVAGIGNPQRFFQQLRDNGIDIIEHGFPDHHDYQQDDFAGWNEDCIIMTEKDAVKCRSLTLPDAWVMTVAAELSATLESRLDSALLPLLGQVTRQ
jgi:tetraacyldisaccharide 4'-kinase